MQGKHAALAVLLSLTAVTVISPNHVRLLVNIFATGVSDTKILSFPVFAALVWLRYFTKRPDVGFKRAVGWLYVTLTALYSMGVASYLYIAKQYAGGSLVWYYVVRDGFFSDNFLNHVHSLKPALGWPFEIYPGVSYQMDLGYPYMAYIPPQLYVIPTLLLALLFYQFWVVTPHVGRRHGYTLSIYLLYAITSFNVVKNVVDGGLISNQLFIALVVFSAVVLGSRRDSRSRIWLLLSASFVVIAAVRLAVSILAVSYAYGWDIVKSIHSINMRVWVDSLSLTSAILFVIVYSSFRWLDSKQSAWRLMACTAAFLVLFSALLYAGERGMLESGSPIPYSLSVLQREGRLIGAGTPVALLMRTDIAAVDNPLYNVTGAVNFTAYQHVWAVTNRPVYGAEITRAIRNPAGRMNYDVGCRYVPLKKPRVMRFAIYDFDAPGSHRFGTLLEVAPVGAGGRLYEAKFNYCLAKPDLVLIQALSTLDDRFILKFPP